jgi:hypothetical protein
MSSGRLQGIQFLLLVDCAGLLVFCPLSVFGQNHLYVRMLQTGIPLFRVKSEEFQSSLSTVRTMCHPVRTPICLLLHPSGRCVILSGRQTVQHHPSGQRASSVRTLHCIEKLLCHLAPSRRFSSTSGSLSVLERFTNSFQVPRKGRSINRPYDVVYHLTSDKARSLTCNPTRTLPNQVHLPEGVFNGTHYLRADL